MTAFEHSIPVINSKNPDKIYIGYTITFEEPVDGKLVHYRKEYGKGSYQISLAKILDPDKKAAKARQLLRLVTADLESGIDPKYRNEHIDRENIRKLAEAKKLEEKKISFKSAVDMCKRAKGWINPVPGKDLTAQSILSLYNNDFHKYLLSIEKDDDIRQVSKADIKAYIESHFNPANGEKGWSATSCATYKGWIAILFNVLIDKDLIENNPCHGIKIKSDQEKILSTSEDNDLVDRFERWSDEEIEIWFNETDNDGDRFFNAVSHVIFYSFIRKIELLRLKVWMVDFSKERFTIPPRLTKAAKKYKTRDNINVDMPDKLVESLKKWIAFKYPSGFTKDDYLFPSPKASNRNFYLNTFNHYYKEIRYRFQDKYEGMFHKNIYALKHSGVTRLFNHLIKTDQTPLQIMNIVKDHCRHSSFTQTEVYMRRLDLVFQEGKKKVNF